MLTRLSLLGLLVMLPLSPRARAGEGAVPPAVQVDFEVEVVARLLDLARRDQDGALEPVLVEVSPGLSADRKGLGPLIAKRAVFACSALRNQNDYGRAEKLALRAVALMAKFSETGDASRSERLYWEAILVGDFLGRKKDGLGLVGRARALAPHDDRLLELELTLLKASVLDPR